MILEIKHNYIEKHSKIQVNYIILNIQSQYRDLAKLLYKKTAREICSRVEKMKKNCKIIIKTI